MSDKLITVPFVAGMRLGSLCNVYTNAIGHGLVFDDVKPVVETLGKLESKAKRVNTDVEAQAFLGISGRQLLCADASKYKEHLGPLEGYLDESVQHSECIEILQSVKYTTKKESVRPDLKPTCSSDIHNKATKPTHYVRSIHYGGYLLASYRFTLKDKERENSDVGASPESWLEFGSSIGAALEREAGKNDFISSTSLRYWSSVCVDGCMSMEDAESLQDTRDKFVDAIKGIDNGAGNPMFVELAPLKSILPSYQGLPPFDSGLEIYLNTLQCLSHELESVYGEAQSLLRLVMGQAVVYNLMDYLHDFITETYPVLMQVREAIDRLDFMATTKQSLFKTTNPETNIFIKGGLDTKMCKEILDLTYRRRFDKLKAVIKDSMAEENPILQATMEYSVKTNEFLVTVIQIRNLPSGGILERNPDPYVVVTITGDSLKPVKRIEKTTEIIQDTKNPAFMVSRPLSFAVTLEQLNALKMQFDVFDKEFVSADDNLTTASIELKTVRITSEQTRRVGLWVKMDDVAN